MKNHSRSRIVAIIPARYNSVRFPGKPLKQILGKSLIQHTYENTARCGSIDRILIATDDRRICDHVVGFGAEAVMTGEFPSGTDRIASVVASDPSLQAAEVIINVQGDEPCLPPDTLEELVTSLQNDPHAAMATIAVRFGPEEDISNPADVKCLFDLDGDALYFSRSPIPGNKTGKTSPNLTYYKHLGVYAFRPQFLLLYPTLPATPLQMAEDLEQLKVLEHGHRIKIVVGSSDSPGVNLPEDLKKVEQQLCKQNSSL